MTGIEAIHLYGGVACIDAKSIFQNRQLEMDRFDNLMLHKKAVGLPCEDAVTNAVNAAKPILDRLTEEEKNSIELLITSTESAIDFGKSLATYVHDYLGLSRHCRLLETKQACYAGTASFQMAANFIESGASPGAKALVIATDTARSAIKGYYAEPSQGTGAVAVLVSDQPDILALDFGATGLYSYEVMDTCRPQPDLELGNPDLSLLSYLDCLENSFNHYSTKVEGADYLDTFQYLAFHTPFPGMVKGAHRMMMRKNKGTSPADSDADFERRFGPAITYCMQVGNLYSATVFLALSSLVDHGDFTQPRRVGLFSYGSGCCSEFYSGVMTQTAQEKLAELNISRALASRRNLSFEEYDLLHDLNMEWIFGIQNQKTDIERYADIYEKQLKGKGLLVLKRVKDYHREYEWS